MNAKTMAARFLLAAHRVWAALAVTGLFAAGCGSSSQDLQEAEKDQGEGPRYTLEYTDVMEFTRGVTGSYRLAGGFTGEPPPRFSVEGLPEDAVHEADTLTWTPSCDLGPASGQFLNGYMVRRLRISMISSVSDNLVQRPAIIIVHQDGVNSNCP